MCLFVYLSFSLINTTQLNSTQLNTTQRNTIQHNTIQHNTIQHNTIQHNRTQHNTIQYNITQYNTIQYNITQHNTTQYNTMHLLQHTNITTTAGILITMEISLLQFTPTLLVCSPQRTATTLSLYGTTRLYPWFVYSFIFPYVHVFSFCLRRLEYNLFEFHRRQKRTSGKTFL